MAVSQINPYKFCIDKHLDSVLFSPIKNSQRVKYTCFHVSSSHVAFGSSSGGVYLFLKCQCSYNFLFTILNDAGPISSLAFAPNDDSIIAIGTNRGNLIIIELKSENNEFSSWKVLYQCNSFTKHAINLMKWDEFAEYRLYFADESGSIYILHNVKSMNSLMIIPSPFNLVKVKGKIFQIDVWGDLLLISTASKCCLYDATDATLTQIGKKPRAYGHYGSCFFRKDIDGNDISRCIFASRPGSRLWEVNLRGDVKLTHQFKGSLISQKPVANIINANEQYLPQESSSQLIPISPTFAKLCVMCIESKSYLLTYSNIPNACLYMIDPIRARIASWCHFDDIQNIHDIYCIGRDIFLLYNTINDEKLKFRKLSILTLDHFLLNFYHHHKLLDAASFVKQHLLYFRERVNHNESITYKVLKDIWLKLNNDETQLFREFGNLFINDTQSSDSISIDLSNISRSDSGENLINKEPYQQNLSRGSLQYFTSLEPENNQSLIRGPSYSSLFNVGPYSNFESNLSIDVVDYGLNELKKLKNNVLTKLNQVGIGLNERNQSPSDSSIVHAHMKESSSSASLNNWQTEHDSKEFKESQSTEELPQVKDTLESLESQLKCTKDVINCKCKCGFPSPNSHLRQSETQVQIQTYIYSKIKYDQYSMKDLMDTCFKNAIWPAYLEILLKCQEFNKYTTLCLMLTDIQLLNREEIHNYLCNKKHFETLLNQFYSQKEGANDASINCLQCNHVFCITENHSITWETLARLCIKKIGAQETINLLKGLRDKIPRSSFSTNFYLYLLRIEMILAYQSPVACKKLDELSSYLNNVSKVPSRDHLSPSNEPLKGGYKINLKGEKCAICQFGLTNSKNDTIVVLRCRHLFHKSCCQTQSQCHLCPSQ